MVEGDNQEGTVHCPVCDHENAVDAKFCSNCGASLAITCPTCSAVSPAGTNFCNNCGTRLAVDPAPAQPADEGLARLIPPEMLNKLRSARSGRAMAGERRTVTMLFADIQGSTSAAEQMDPEDWADVVNLAFAKLIEPIYRYEGTLARLLGDGVLAFFGAPIAHEDDPTRAIRAGLDIIDGMAASKADILDRYGIPIDVRVGINTGLVVVGEVGSDFRVEYTALGDAINVAARMEQTAEPGTVQVSDRTFGLTHGAFEATDLGLIEVKGKAEPVRTFRPTAYVGTLPLRSATRHFVGRETEAAQLMDLIDRLEAGAGWIASVIAEAGLGKSALLDEWERRAQAAYDLARHPGEAGDISLMTGASQSYDAAKPMSGFRNVLRRWFDLDGTDDHARILAAIGAEADPDLAAFLGHVAGADLPADAAGLIESQAPPVLLGRSRQAVVDYVTSLSAERPVLIGFEDLHWSDDLTIDLITDLVATTETHPVGIAIAMRPYRDDPSWRVHERAARDHAHRYHPIELSPLDAAAAEDLLRDLIGDLDLDADQVRSVLDRSAGNPLFLEEIAGSLSAGGSVGGVPDSLAGILAARLDRLDEQARLVAQVASVLGTMFDRDTVAALVDGNGLAGTITDLLRTGILIESAAAPGRLQFRHALLRDAAYSSVLLKTRRRLHGEVATHLVAHHPDSAPDIAQHFVAAEDFDSAFPHLVEAGLRATRAMALADSIRDLRLALDHVPDGADPDLIQLAHLTLGETYALLPDLSESAAAFQRLFDFGEQTERPTAQVAALNQLGFTTATAGGDVVKANEYLQQARILAEQVGDERGLVEYHMNACMVAAFQGDPEAAARHDTQTSALGAAIGDDRIRLEGLRRRSMNLALSLDFEQAEQSANLAAAAAEASGLEVQHAELQVLGRSLVTMGRGLYREAADVTERQLQILERYRSFDLPIAHAMLGEYHLILGNPESALSSFVETRRVAGLVGQPFSDSFGAAGMAAAYAALGRPDDAAAAAAQTSIGAGPMGDYFASSAWYHVGTMHGLIGDHGAAAEAFTRGVASPSVVQYLDRARLLTGLVIALVQAGETERATTVLAELDEYVARKPMAISVPATKLAHAHVSAATGHRSDAVTEARQAIAGFDDMDARWPSLQAATFLAGLDGDAEDVARRAAAIAAGIVDDDLQASFLARWADPAHADT